MVPDLSRRELRTQLRQGFVGQAEFDGEGSAGYLEQMWPKSSRGSTAQVSQTGAPY
jgi:hypothetical protein